MSNFYALPVLNEYIKFVVFDFDGVFTDGKIYYTQNGDSFKSFNFHDGYGLILLKERGIKIGLITGHDTKIIDNMDRFINRFDYVYKGNKPKIEVLNEWRNLLGFDWKNIAFMGDDGPDKECMKMCGSTACPRDGTKLVQSVAHYRCKNNGGNGAVREFIDHLLQ